MSVLQKARFRIFAVFLIAMFSMTINFEEAAIWSFRFPTVTEMIFVIIAAVMAKDEHKWQWQEIVLSIMYTGFILVGRGFIGYDWDAWIAHLSVESMIKWGMALPGFYLICAPIVHAVFAYAREHDQQWVNIGRTNHWLDRHPFLYPFLILTLLQLPSYILCYPGIMIPVDNFIQLNGFFRAVIEGEKGAMSAHHPPMHTILLGGAYGLAKLYSDQKLLGTEFLLDFKCS